MSKVESGKRLPWLLMIHQLPAQPAYQRVKVWRRLQSLGAVAVKKSVYALPHTEGSLEDLLWTAKEIEAAGGEALVCEAHLLLGTTDQQLRALFNAARSEDYHALAAEAKALQGPIGKRRVPPGDAAAATVAVSRVRKRFRETTEIDYFGAEGRESADGILREVETRLATLKSSPAAPARAGDGSPKARSLKGKTWVTRQGVHIDRVACAWLIRRFIDPKAKFRFVNPASYRHAAGELRFDMSDAEFTHRGDRCSFEVLLGEANIKDAALAAIAEIVHDLDLKDGKFGRPEADGVRSIIAGITLATEDDNLRVRQASGMFENLYRSLR